MTGTSCPVSGLTVYPTGVAGREAVDDVDDVISSKDCPWDFLTFKDVLLDPGNAAR